MEIFASSQMFSKATEAADFIKKHLSTPITKPAIGVICGSGLGGLADLMAPEMQIVVNYSNIPHFPKSTVPGHAGKLVIGSLKPNLHTVVMMVGRAHFFEGHSIQDVVFPVRVMKLLGIETLIVTNAAGGLNPSHTVGDLVLLGDHINYVGLGGFHPLRGENDDKFGVRFPPLSDAYDLGLRRLAHQKWSKLSRQGRRLHEGIYAYCSGPSYETRAECRLLRMHGADVVGMSTVPEVIAARHCGIRVMAMSLVTNRVVSETGPSGDDPAIQALSAEELKNLSISGIANHQEVLDEGKKAAADMQALVESILLELTSASCS